MLQSTVLQSLPREVFEISRDRDVCQSVKCFFSSKFNVEMLDCTWQTLGQK